jgi:outer membrane receptor for ferrienterochelin and colicins
LQAALAGSFVWTSSGPRAQLVDYGALQQVFGEPVTMSATGKPQRAAEAPANIEIITQDDIRRSGATNIPEVLRFVVGVDVRRNGITNADVGVRGYNQAGNPRLQVLMDGRQLYLVEYAEVNWATIPVQLDEIRQIELIKGPNAALYGFNAVGGVINIVTYDPLADRINAVSLRGGTQHYQSGSAVGTAQLGEVAGIRLSLGGLRSRDFDSGPLAAVDHANRGSAFNESLNLDARARFSQTTDGFVQASWSDTSDAEASPLGPFNTRTYRAGSLRIGANADTALGLLSVSASRSQMLVSNPITFPQPIGISDRETITVVQASNLLKLGTDHALRLGLEYRANAFVPPTAPDSEFSEYIYAASLMWDWRIAPRLSLTNAMRIDRLQLQHAGPVEPAARDSVAQLNRTALTAVSVNTGLVWQVTDLDTLRVTAARGVQLPAVLNFVFAVPAGPFGGVAYSALPELSPSIVWNGELDYDRAITPIHSTLRSAIFVQRTETLLAAPVNAPFAFIPGGRVFVPGTGGHSVALGAEFALKGASEAGFRWNLSYALVTTSDAVPASTAEHPNGAAEFAHAVPRHVVIAGIGYARDRFELDLVARWQSSLRDFRIGSDGLTLMPVEVGNAITMATRFGYRLSEHMTASVTAQQFNRSRLIETAGPPVERRIIVGLTVRL